MAGVIDTYAPFSVSNDLVSDPAALRARMKEEGYLFFRGLGPRDQIMAARRDVLDLCRQAGWCDPDGIWTGAGPYTEGDADYVSVYRRVIKLRSFLAVPEDPFLLGLIGMIVDGPVMLHRLRIGRITFPNNVEQTTAAHQDHWYVRGTPDTYTIWTPLGDCPMTLGGLAVLPGSHRAGFVEHHLHAEKKYAGHGLQPEQIRALASAREETSSAGDSVRWVAGDFEAGDFLLFHSFTVHKALPNLSRNRLRISTDNRYQREGEAISEISRGTHYNL